MSGLCISVKEDTSPPP